MERQIIAVVFVVTQLVVPLAPAMPDGSRSTMAADKLSAYEEKRNFKQTKEPSVLISTES